MKSNIETQQSFKPVSVTLTLESKKEVAAFLAIARASAITNIVRDIDACCAEADWHLGVYEIERVLDGLLSDKDFDTLKAMVK